MPLGNILVADDDAAIRTVLNQALSRVLRVGFRLGAFDPPGSSPYATIGMNVVRSPEHLALALGKRAEALVLGKGEGEKKLAGAGSTPSPLAGQELGEGHALGLPGALTNHFGGIELAAGDVALQGGPGKPNPVRMLQGLHVLGCRGSMSRGNRCSVHEDSSL